MAFFAFGCSFTSYYWPTWADIIGKEFEYFENWGQSGGGNQFIFNSLMECVVKNKISKDDTVIIMWTNISREDRYVNHKWITPGNIFNQSTYTQDFIKEFADIRGYLIRDLNTIFATQNILKSIGCKFHFLSMVPLTNPDQYYNDDHKDKLLDIVKYFESTLQQILPSVYEVVFDFNWTGRPFYVSSDAISPAEHNYKIIKDSTWPEWPKNVQEETTFIAKLSDTIKKECLENFQLDLYHYSASKNKPRYKRKWIDYHPIPSEHLQYLEKVLPEIEISKLTRDWVLTMDADVKLNRCKWRPETPIRW